MKLDDVIQVYFIGIGGIGMSALARYFHNRGAVIHGYDRTRTALTRTLEIEGMQIHYDEDVSAIPEHLDLVIYTPAIPETHAELTFLRNLGLPVKKRSEVLGMISRERKCIAVAGTHGKTSTSAILAHLLKRASVDCTAFVGGIMKNYDSNFLDGQSEWMVVEADEYDRSFLQLEPEISLLLSMDPDHLDIYGDPENMEKTYVDFLRKTRQDGQIIIREELAERMRQHLSGEVLTFGKKNADVQLTDLHHDQGAVVFTLRGKNWQIVNVRFPFPGLHNALNATAAAGVCRILGVEENTIRKGLESFKGIKRRFERILETDEVVIIDDYAHHPTEIEAFLHGVRQLYPGKKVTGIFQPHLYSRTRDFAEGFAKALSQLDELILLDIYPAREEPIPGVSSGMIKEKITGIPVRMATKETLPDMMKTWDVEVLLTIGAGDIDTLIEPIKNIFEDEMEGD